MKYFLIIICFLSLCINTVLAQSPAPQVADTVTHPFKKIMVIPFEEISYISHIQGDLVKNSGKTHKEVIRFFRYGIASALQYQFLQSCATTSLIHYNDTTHDLDRTYASVYYKFEPYVEEVSEDKLNAKESSKKSDSKNAKGNKEQPIKIKDGQVISVKNKIPKFASLQIKDSTILHFLNEKYGADLFVFITQLDIENDLSDQLALANESYLRFIRAHYAMVDLNGVFLAKGVVKVEFPNTVNDMESIQKIYFPLLALKLQNKLPKITKPKVPGPPKNEESKIKAD